MISVCRLSIDRHTGAAGHRTASLGSVVLGASCLALLLAACATLRVGSDYDRHENFAGYHSYAWLPRERYGTQNPLVVQRARDAIQATLTAKGFTYVADAAGADFIVDFTIGSRDRMDVHAYPAPFAGPWYGAYGWWGYPYWGTGVDVRTYREGTLSIDTFDAHTHRPTWHGWAKKELTSSDIERSEAPIREAVDAVLASFPPAH